MTEPARPEAATASSPAVRRAFGRPATLAACGLVALALAETGAAVYHVERTASREDYLAAAAEVRAGFRPGDLVTFAPAWMDPVGRMYLGDLLPIPVAGRMDSDRYGRVWEVSLHGRAAPECGGAKVAEEAWHGAIRVRLCTRTAPAVLYDFVARALDDARVLRAPDGAAPAACVRRPGADRFACPPGSPPWNYVGPVLAEVDYTPKWCVWAHPIDRGEMRVVFPAAPLGRQLVGWAGIADFDARHLYDKARGVYRSPPADLEVRIDGSAVARLRSDSDSGWRRFAVDTSRWAGGAHEVTFVTRAPQGAELRQLCFAAESRAP